MRKSKYLIINSFYFDFNDDLSEITNVKELFKNQNILDIFRFDKLISIKENQFMNKNINFIYLPKNIEKINFCAFDDNQIESLDLSNCINLKVIGYGAFANNQIKQLKLPDSIKLIDVSAFSSNKIEILDISNCTNLNNIKFGVMRYNKIKQLKLPKNIMTIEENAFETNEIEILDLLEYNQLKNIFFYAFSSNPIKEVKILDNIEIEYDIDYYKNDMWNNFAKYYDKNEKKAGDYKYIYNKWQWYPL